MIMEYNDQAIELRLVLSQSRCELTSYITTKQERK
jgi:hypothetical protein